MTSDSFGKIWNSVLAVAVLLCLGDLPADEVPATNNLPAEQGVKVLNGFEYEKLTANVQEPMDLEFAPDGTLWITGRDGYLWRYTPGTKLFQEIKKLPVDHSDDRGLHGLAFDPGFSTNGYLYLHYAPVSHEGHKNRVSRFTLEKTGGSFLLNLESEKVLIEFPSESVGQHQGGAVEYNPADGKLYISTGDNNNIPDLEKYWNDPLNKAQNLGDLRGKVLRLNLDGTIPKDNPFFGQSGKRGEIFTCGHRQPFSLRVDAKHGIVLLGENGGDRNEDFEEINALKAGGNYGWPRLIGTNIPAFGGTNPIPNAVLPWFSYQRLTGASCTVGPVYSTVPGKYSYPKEYEGVVFYADYNRKWLRYIKVEPDGSAGKSEPFARGFGGGVLALAEGPDGALYLAEYGGWMNASSKDSISRITFKGPKK